MVKKGILKKTGCILISASIMLTGVTFFGNSTSEADYDSNSYKYTIEANGSISSSTLTSEQKSELQSVVGEGSATIGDSALSECYNLTSVSVAGQLAIGGSAFAFDNNLQSITCETMTGATGSSFNGCSNISFNITGQSEGSGYYTDSYGALYNGTTLVYVPSGVSSAPEYTLRDGTTAIGAGAFNDANITTLNVPNKTADGITSIGEQVGWPSSSLVVNAYGSTADSAIAFANYFETHLVVVNWAENGSSDTPDDPTTTVTVTVTMKASDGSFPTDVSSYTKNAGDVITPIEITGYSVSPTSYTVTSASTQSVEFVYTPTATAEDPYVTVTDEYYDSTGATLVSSNKDRSSNYKENATINPLNPSGYTLFAGSAYTVGSAKTGQAVTFKYKANGSTPTPTPTPGATYTVTVYDEFYKGDLNHLEKRTTRSVNKYTAGSKYSFNPATYKGYTYYGGRDQSGTVNGNIEAYFFYVDNGSSKAAVVPSVKKNETNANLQCIYQVTEGANQTITAGNGPLRIVCNGELNKLTGIFVDGVKIDSSRYTLESGSTILTFTGGFVKMFTVGNHLIRFEYVDGYAETGLKVTDGKTTTTVTYKVSSDGSISAGHTKDTTPKTADGFDNKYLLCIAIFLLGAGAILFGNQRKLEAILAKENDDE